ncbi:MAG: hypothetical protein R6W75_07285 [Smithellaceae bacterium]
MPVLIDPRAPAIATQQMVLTGKPEGLPGLAVGETLQARVLEKIAEGKYLLSLKNSTLMASSSLPLRAGENLPVRVTATGPQILLTILDPGKQHADGRVQEQLLQWRANPDALLSVMNKLGEFSSLLKSDALPLKFTQSEVNNLIRLFDQMILSPRTKGDPLFVRNFVNTSGLLLEKALGDIVSGAVRNAPSNLTDNLKAALLRLSDQIVRAQMQGDKVQPPIMNKLQVLATLTQDALKTIETRQAVNVVFQQSDQGLYLQVPLALGDMLRLADVFIRPDGGNENKGEGFGNCTITIFLNLDYLGELSIEARLREGNFHCVISCEDDDVKTLINEKVTELWTALESLGYHVDALRCLRNPDLESKRIEFLSEQSFSRMNLINFFV